MAFETSENVAYNPQIYTAPQAGYKFMQPWYEDYQRRLGSSVFGTPGGVGGLLNQPQDIPLQQTAGLSPLMMQARYGLSGASPYTQAYDTSSQLMNEAAGGYRGSTAGFNPYTMISPYYDPFETQVVDDTLERMRRTSAQQDIAGRAQDVSSGAFGGSRGRLLAKERQRESDRGIMQALSGIRSQGFQSSRDAAMAENARRMAAMSGAAGGLGGIAGQVLGLGGQRQQEMMNYLNMMNQYGGQGRDIYDMGLSRMYDAAMRRSQEPWDRVMRGMGVLSGFRPGELQGGYTTQSSGQPQIGTQPTSFGNTLANIQGIGSAWDLIKGLFGNAQGGYIEAPKEYNAGGIVSGIVPINMATGGGLGLEIPDWVKDAIEDPSLDPENMTEEQVRAYEWLAKNQSFENIEDEPGLGSGSIVDLLLDPAITKISEGEYTEAGISPAAQAINHPARAAMYTGLAKMAKGISGGIPGLVKTIATETPKIVKRNKKSKKLFDKVQGGPRKATIGDIGKPIAPKPPKMKTGDLSGLPALPAITRSKTIAERLKGLGPKAKSIAVGKPIGEKGIGWWEGTKRATGKGARILGLYVGGKALKDYMTGMSDEEKAEIMAKLNTLTEEQMAEVALEKERLDKIEDKKKRTRAFSRFVDTMYERPTTLGDLGRMYEEEKLGIVPSETVAGKEIEEISRLTGLSPEVVNMMQNPTGAYFSNAANERQEQIANIILVYLQEQGLVDAITAVERRAELMDLPADSLEKIAIKLGIPLTGLGGPKFIEPRE